MGESDIIDMEDDEKGETAATRGGTPGPPFTPSPATAYPLFQHKSYRNPESNPRPSSGQPARPSPRPRASPVHLTRRPARVPAPVLPERRAASAGLFASGGASARVWPALSACAVLACPRRCTPSRPRRPCSPLSPVTPSLPPPAAQHCQHARTPFSRRTPAARTSLSRHPRSHTLHHVVHLMTGGPTRGPCPR